VERELMNRPPALLVVYGDVNSTLGAALAAAKLHVPVAHVEAGLRSFDNTMPEEINRRLTDQLCELLFVTSPEAVGYLGREGIAADGVHPRGRAVFEVAGLAEHPGIRMCEPLGYLEFMSLVRGAAAAITDSAGVQEETTFLRVPCLTLRPVTERPVTVISGSNRLVRADELASAAQDALARGPYAGELPPLWDGASGPRIARIIAGWLATRGQVRR
jgi:UDP-N-acetylglucosamine 2-epimerase